VVVLLGRIFLFGEFVDAGLVDPSHTVPSGVLFAKAIDTSPARKQMLEICPNQKFLTFTTELCIIVGAPS
jgi:hypothetical protein